MTGRLRCYSFHSVKGGVGKSTLSVVSALGLAQQGHRVTLIDMDLTGTSLADVLPLEAPRWKAVSSAQEVLPLLRKPDDFWSPKETEKLIPQRDLALREREKHAPIGVPFLNDFLLFATEDWDGQDAPVETMLWRMKGVEGPGTLHIVPSSALPPDLEQTLPVIFDEQHSAFLESRLEYLLDALVPDEGEAVVVVDTPPTIPGLSRSVLSLALRLGGEKKIPLSKDGGMPRRLEQAEIHWTAFLVMSMDPQDLRAAARWLSLASPEEQNQLRPLINRAPPGDPQQLMHMVKDIVEIGNGEANPLLEHPAWVPEAAGFRVFRSEDPRTLSVEALNFLEVLSG